MTDSRVCVYGQTTPNILNKQNKQKLCAHSTVKVNITNDLVQMHIINHIIWLHCPLPIVIVVMIKRQYKTSALFIAQRSELVYMWPALSNDRSRDEQWPNYRHWINHNTNFCILLFMLDNQYMRTCVLVYHLYSAVHLYVMHINIVAAQVAILIQWHFQLRQSIIIFRDYVISISARLTPTPSS